MAAGNTLQGRRREPFDEGDGVERVPLHDFEPGDYCGPLEGFTGDKPAVFYLLPNARDEDVPPSERSLHHVTSPPHTFAEENDGSLTISASILSPGGWHGYLERGVWREV